MYSVVIWLICQALFNLAYLNAIQSVELIFAKLIGWFIIGKQFSIIKLFGLLFMIVSSIVTIKGTDNKKTEDSTIDFKEIC